MTNAKRIRLEKGMTQLELTLRSGIASSQITNIERTFDVENLSLKTVCRIAKALDVKIWDVINDPCVIEKLHDVDEIESGFFLNGEVSPILELRTNNEITQTQLSKASNISQSQICKWERYGMDTAKLKNFIDVAKAFHVHPGLLIWDQDFQNLYDEVT